MEKNVNKKRDSSEAYLSRTTKKEVAAHVVGSSRGCNDKCYDRVGHDNIKLVFRNFWGFQNYNAQSHYLFTPVTPELSLRRIKGNLA